MCRRRKTHGTSDRFWYSRAADGDTEYPVWAGDAIGNDPLLPRAAGHAAGSTPLAPASGLVDVMVFVRAA